MVRSNIRGRAGRKTCSTGNSKAIPARAAMRSAISLRQSENIKVSKVWPFYYFLVLLALFFASLPSVSASVEKRVALVIGNSAYSHASSLRNPKNNHYGDSLLIPRRLALDFTPAA